MTLGVWLNLGDLLNEYLGSALLTIVSDGEYVMHGGESFPWNSVLH